MQFMYILSENPDVIDSDEARTDAVRRTGEYAMDMLGRGKLVGGAPLRPAAEARRLRRSASGETQVLDGPFTETKEVIAGYAIVEAASLEEAVELARACPNVEFGSVEVREIVPLG